MSRLTEIPYHFDSAELFARIADRRWAVFLDSGFPFLDRERYDILACDPYLRLSFQQGYTRIEDAQGTRCSRENPLLLLRRALGGRERNLPGLPFIGGAIGYCSYDLGRLLNPLQSRLQADLPLPEFAFGIYDWALVVDHHQHRSWLVGQERDAATARIWTQLQEWFQPQTLPPPVPPLAAKEVRASMDRERYAHAFWRIQEYIRQGECYQVNLALRFDLDCTQDPWDLYRYLRKINPAPFAAFMQLSAGSVLCCSPERFLRVQDGMVETRPIKGTRPRGSAGYEDLAQAEMLLNSAKDRAENLMIVDLLRNDLGKNCRVGTISVPSLFALESFATVHHLVSTVSGQLAVGRDALDLLMGSFPGGSITGAPKLRAMEIIEELEPCRRSVYCGSIGYLGFDGNMDSNISIRTLVHCANRLYFWSGGGLVADSVPEQEYQEIHSKVSAFFQLLRIGVGG